MTDQLIIFAAKYFILVPILAVIAVVLWQIKQRQWRYIAIVALGGIIALILAKTASQFITNPRPFVEGGFAPLVAHEADNGFPSDHMLLAASLALSTLWLNQKIGWTLCFIALLIGAGRVGAGVHHLEDIVGSIVFAAAGTVLAIWLTGLVTKRRASGKKTAKV